MFQLIAILAALLSTACYNHHFPDGDNDGLDDTWELAHSDLGVSPEHADLIVIAVIRPNMVPADAQATLSSAIAFFSRMPTANLDGTTGINMIVQWGNALPDTDADNLADPALITPYWEIYDRGMPRQWIGKGHGVLIGSYGGGGGQTSSSNWSGVSNDWWSLVHEMGHQLGLEHEPRGTGIGSPFYTSLMNYDYTYGFDGSSTNVQFSTGKFANLSFDENNLNENIPLPVADLHFLTLNPYYFTVQAVTDTTSSIDFNRNGIHGEVGIRADINNGYAVQGRELSRAATSAGAPALTAFNGRLFAITATPGAAVDWTVYNQSSLTAAAPGGLQYQSYTPGALSAALPLIPSGVAGDPHAVEAFGQLFVTFPTATGYAVYAYRSGVLPGSLVLTGFVEETSAPGFVPTLVRSPAALYVVLWDSDTRDLSLRPVNVPMAGNLTLGTEAVLIRSGSLPTRFSSRVPAGAAWDSRTDELTVAYTSPSNVLWMAKFHPVFDDEWQSGTPTLVGGVNSLTDSRPTVLFDESPSAGARGHYFIYSLGWRWDGDATVGIVHQLVSSTSTTPVWVNRMMLNEWTLTRVAPTAAFYDGDIVWGWRLGEFDPLSPNQLLFYAKASGIGDSGMTDFDDVGWISNTGLALSLVLSSP